MPKLKEAIGETGATGETVEKVIAFLVAMAKDANIPLSGYLTARAVASRRVKSKPRNQSQPNGGGSGPLPPQILDMGAAMKTVQLRAAKGHMTLSGTFSLFDLAGDERELVFSIIDKMKAFEAAHPDEDQEGTE